MNVLTRLLIPGDFRIELDDLRKAVTDLTTVTAAQNERIAAQALIIAGQAGEIDKANKEIDLLRRGEANARGELREALTRISSQDALLFEERSARMQTAIELGALQVQLKGADERLKYQSDQIKNNDAKIVSLENELAKYRGLYAGTEMAKTALELDLAAARAETGLLRQQHEAMQKELAEMRRQ